MRGRGVSTAVHAVAAAINIVAVKTGVSSTIMRLRSASNSPALGSRRKCRLTVVELSSVELVTFLHNRQFARLRRQWSRVQVGMLKCVDRIDAPFPVEPHEFSEEGNSTLSVSITASDPPSSRFADKLRVDLLSETMAKVTRSRPRLDCLRSGKVSKAWHVVLRGRATQVKDNLKLVVIALTSQDRLSPEHFSKDATDNR